MIATEKAIREEAVLLALDATASRSFGYRVFASLLPHCMAAVEKTGMEIGIGMDEYSERLLESEEERRACLQAIFNVGDFPLVCSTCGNEEPNSLYRQYWDRETERCPACMGDMCPC